MNLAQRISSLTHSLRKSAKIRVRQPLKKILVPVLNDQTKAHIEQISDLIINEVNVKEVDLISDDSGILVKSVKPNFKSLGQKYKKDMKAVQQVIKSFEKEDISTIEREGKLSKGGFDLILDDILITSQEVEGFSVANEAGITVALDTEVTEELRKEGLARDFVNRIQNLRKDTGLEVQDKIHIQVNANDDLVKTALETFKDYISEETQALSLDFTEDLKEAQEFEVEDFKFEVAISVN